jgi:hypothetical protein
MMVQPNLSLKRTARRWAMLASSVSRVFVRWLAFAALTAAADAQNTVNYGTTRASKAMSEADIRAYLQARAACDRQSAAKQEQCRVELASKWSHVDAKCQKLSGTSLDECVRGMDRGQ